MNTRLTKENSDAITKATRESAPPTVVSTANLGSLGTNVLQTAQAYNKATDAEGAKAARLNMTPEQKAKMNAYEASESLKTGADGYFDPNSGEYISPVAEDLKALSKPAVTVPKANLAVSTPPLGAIATPVSQTVSSVNPGAVNTVPEQEPQKPKFEAEAATAPFGPSKQDPMLEMVSLLKTQIELENAHKEVSEQILRSSSTSPLPNNQWLVDRVRRV